MVKIVEGANNMVDFNYLNVLPPIHADAISAIMGFPKCEFKEAALEYIKKRSLEASYERWRSSEHFRDLENHASAYTRQFSKECHSEYHPILYRLLSGLFYHVKHGYVGTPYVMEPLQDLVEKMEKQNDRHGKSSSSLYTV